MKRISHIFQKITILSVFTLLLFSCTKEDMSDCPTEIRVYFTFTPQTINPANVDRMHLYVFSHDGYFVDEYLDNDIARFSTDYYIDCSGLQPGNYRFIAWGGKDDRYYATAPAYFVKGQTTFHEALLMLQHPGNTLSTPEYHLFHAALPANVLAIQKLQTFYMPLVQLSNTINISTIGLQEDADAYRFNITDINCSYHFDSSFASHSHEPVTYTAPCTKDGASQLHASLNVLRLAANRRTPQLEIYNETTGKALYPVNTQSGDLIGLILSAYPHNDFDTTHNYDIVFNFTTDLKVNITVNGWQVHDQEGELIE